MRVDRLWLWVVKADVQTYSDVSTMVPFGFPPCEILGRVAGIRLLLFKCYSCCYDVRWCRTADASSLFLMQDQSFRLHGSQEILLLGREK